MSLSKSGPPRLAVWLLRYGCRGFDTEALTGDLVESFREGKTSAWFWKQVLTAITVSVTAEAREHWPVAFYALVGTVLPAVLWQSVHGAGFWFRWWSMPWPWSQLALEVSPTVMLALAALLVLAIALIVNRTFSWLGLFRTGVISLALLTLAHYSIDAFPRLLRPIPGEPWNKHLIIPQILRVLLYFSSFLVAGWLGVTRQISARGARIR